MPKDIALVGFDDIEDGRYSTPSLTTISPDKTQIAKNAVQLLMQRLDGDRSAPPTTPSHPAKAPLPDQHERGRLAVATALGCNGEF